MDEFESLSISGGFRGYGESRVVILPAPYEATVTGRKGTARGPRAIIEAFLNIELYDEELRDEPCKCGICLMNPPDLSGGDPVEAVREGIRGILRDGKFPVLLGGEHSISIGSVRALKLDYPRLSVLQLDAHADLRDEYLDNRFSHACVMSRIREEADAVQVGIRSLSRGEAELIDEKDYAVFWAKDIYDNRRWYDKAIDSLGRDVYITVDLDVFDIGVMPSVGTPEPGGLGWYNTLGFLREVCMQRNVVGFDLVELCPDERNPCPDFLAARLMYKLIGYVMVSRKWRI